MQDLVAKVDWLKQLISGFIALPPREEPPEHEKAETVLIAIDLAVELVVNSRRIAVALEKLAAPITIHDPMDV